MRPRPLAEATVRVGVDLVAVERLSRLLAEHEGAAAELFTAAELAYCAAKRRRSDHLAARFAAKEAVLKSFGTGLSSRMSWTEVEVANDRMGRPFVVLHGGVATWAERHGVKAVDISLTHAAGLAIAQAVTTFHRAA